MKPTQSIRSKNSIDRSVTPNLFFLVTARDKRFVRAKIRELSSMEVPFLIVCGEPMEHPQVIYRRRKGKYDAINFGAQFISPSVDLIALNDVDTKIRNFNYALEYIGTHNTDMIYAKIVVSKGPQRIFLRLLDSARRILPIAANGELILIKRNLFEKIVPLRPCKSEDTYILFKALEFGASVKFIERCYLETETTSRPQDEEAYKRRTVTGIYQALAQTDSPIVVKAFYLALPLIFPALLVLGKKGYYIMKGIIDGLVDYLRGDKSGMWQPNYTR